MTLKIPANRNLETESATFRPASPASVQCRFVCKCGERETHMITQIGSCLSTFLTTTFEHSFLSNTRVLAGKRKDLTDAECYKVERSQPSAIVKTQSQSRHKVEGGGVIQTYSHARRLLRASAASMACETVREQMAGKKTCSFFLRRLLPF